MSIMKRNDLFPSVIGLFDDFLMRDLPDWNMGNHSLTRTTVPAVNISENDDAFEVEMAAPGMQREDFRVELDGNTLVIFSEKTAEQKEEDPKKYARREFSYQSFRRTFQLPKDVVDAENIAARYEHGVLKLHIPKKEEVKKRPPKMIEIR